MFSIKESARKLSVRATGRAQTTGVLSRLATMTILFASVLLGTTLTGTAKKPDGTSLNGFIYLNLSQQASLTGGCGGPAIVLPTTQVKIAVTSGALASTSVFGNDCLNPQNTYYNVRYIDLNGNTVFTDRWVITGSSVDVGTIVSAVITGTTQTLGTTGVLFFSPAGNQTINQPTGTSTSVNRFAVTSLFTLPNGGTCDASGCTNVFTNGVTLNTAQTITGQKTFSQSLLFSGTADVGALGQPVNNVWASNIVNGLAMRMYLGSVASPTDFYIWQNTGIHQFDLINSSAQTVMRLTDGISPVFSFKGTGLYQGLAGTGNAFACLDSTGKLYRSATACN